MPNSINQFEETVGVVGVAVVVLAIELAVADYDCYDCDYILAHERVRFVKEFFV